MKMQKWKLICFVLLVMALAVGFTAVFAGSARIGVLSDVELASLTGGATWCDCDGVNSKCKCMTYKCKDIACSPCSESEEPGGITYGCKGHSDDWDDVMACYDTTTASDSCTRPGGTETDCYGDSWNSTQCFSTPDDPDVLFYDDGCTP